MFRSDSIITDFKTNFKSNRLPCRLNQLILIQEILVPAINFGATISIFVFLLIFISKIYKDENSKKIQNLKNIPILKYILEASRISALSFFIATTPVIFILSSPMQLATLFRIPIESYPVDFNYYNRSHPLSIAKQYLLKNARLMRRNVLEKHNNKYKSVLGKTFKHKAVLMKMNPKLRGYPLLEVMPESFYANLLRDQCRHEAFNFSTNKVILNTLMKSENLTEEFKLYLLGLVLHHNIQLNKCCELLIKASNY